MHPAVNFDELYTAAQTGCVLFERASAGRLWMPGRDRLDLLHRMSTNDMTGMALNTVRQTVLTNHLGRIVDCVDVLNLSDGALVLTSPDQSGAVRAWLARHVFFQDDVQLRDTTAEMDQILLLGAGADTVGEVLFAGASLPGLQQVIRVGEVIVARMAACGSCGFEIIGPVSAVSAVRAQAIAAGALSAPPSLLHLLRVEAGAAGAGAEISSAYNPLEVGLWPAVSFSKGCYIGQEIIARMESRGRLAKTLVGLQSNLELMPGAELVAPDATRGIVTSSAHSARFGWIALALLKPASAIPGTQVIAEQGAERIPAQVVPIPFGR